MKRAVRLPQYSNTTDFTPPSGVVTVSLDKATNLLATQAARTTTTRSSSRAPSRRRPATAPTSATCSRRFWASRLRLHRRSTSRRARFRPTSRARPPESKSLRSPEPRPPTRLPLRKSERESGAKWLESSTEMSKDRTRTRAERIPTQDRSGVAIEFGASIRGSIEFRSIYSAMPGALPSRRVCAERRARSSRWRWRKWP